MIDVRGPRRPKEGAVAEPAQHPPRAGTRRSCARRYSALILEKSRTKSCHAFFRPMFDNSAAVKGRLFFPCAKRCFRASCGGTVLNLQIGQGAFLTLRVPFPLRLRAARGGAARPTR